MIPITPIEMDVGQFRRQQSVGLGGGGGVGQRGTGWGSFCQGRAADEMAAARPQQEEPSARPSTTVGLTCQWNE